MARQPTPHDPYEIGLPNRFRNFVKHMLNAIINAKDKRIARPKIYNADEAGISWKELRAKTEKHHKAIKRYFYSGYGLKLQKTDGDMANFIMRQLANQNIPCLGIHDSFIVKIEHVKKLRHVMEEAVTRYGRTNVQIKYEEGQPNKVTKGNQKHYSGYIRRLEGIKSE